MAVLNDTTDITGFQVALAALTAVTSLRRPGLSDDSTDFIEEASAPLFDRMLAAPCDSLTEIVSKGEAILAEYGDATIAPEMVSALVADIRGLVQ